MICPQYDPTQPLCCNDDQVEIMCKNTEDNFIANNFRSIDLVFGNDCSICASNLKRMWCDYTCNPNKIEFGNLNLSLTLSQSKEQATSKTPSTAT